MRWDAGGKRQSYVLPGSSATAWPVAAAHSVHVRPPRGGATRRCVGSNVFDGWGGKADLHRGRAEDRGAFRAVHRRGASRWLQNRRLRHAPRQLHPLGSTEARASRAWHRQIPGTRPSLPRQDRHPADAGGDCAKPTSASPSNAINYGRLCCYDRLCCGRPVPAK